MLKVDHYFNPRSAGPLDFPPPAGGDCPPSISAHAHFRAKRKTASESSLKNHSETTSVILSLGQI